MRRIYVDKGSIASNAKALAADPNARLDPVIAYENNCNLQRGFFLEIVKGGIVVATFVYDPRNGGDASVWCIPADDTAVRLSSVQAIP